MIRFWRKKSQSNQRCKVYFILSRKLAVANFRSRVHQFYLEIPSIDLEEIFAFLGRLYYWILAPNGKRVRSYWRFRTIRIIPNYDVMTVAGESSKDCVISTRLGHIWAIILTILKQFYRLIWSSWTNCCRRWYSAVDSEGSAQGNYHQSRRHFASYSQLSSSSSHLALVQRTAALYHCNFSEALAI